MHIFTSKSIGFYELLVTLSEISQNETNGVLDADILVVLLPGGKGTHTELGMALASKKPIIIHSETQEPFNLGDQTCAFYHHPHVIQITSPISELETLIEAFESQELVV